MRSYYLPDLTRFSELPCLVPVVRNNMSVEGTVAVAGERICLC